MNIVCVLINTYYGVLSYSKLWYYKR